MSTRLDLLLLLTLTVKEAELIFFNRLIPNQINTNDPSRRMVKIASGVFKKRVNPSMIIASMKDSSKVCPRVINKPDFMPCSVLLWIMAAKSGPGERAPDKPIINEMKKIET